MRIMNREELRAMQKGFAELRAFELEEKRAALPKTRMRQLDCIWSMARELKVPMEPPEFDHEVNDQWLRLRKAIYERNRTAPE